MSSIIDDQDSILSKNQGNNLKFLSMGIGIQNSLNGDYSPRIHNWTILDDELFEETLSSKTENLIDDIDSGKEQLNTYSNVSSYLKHLDNVLEE